MFSLIYKEILKLKLIKGIRQKRFSAISCSNFIFCTVISVALAISALNSIPATAASIYVYVDSQGNRLITDRPRSTQGGYKLVKSYVADDNFLDPKRGGKTRRGLKARASDYDKLILSKARELGLEPALLKAIIHIESAFNPTALSPAGAKGLMQLMPATAARYGVTDRTSPEQSLEGGGRYMVDLLQMFKQDTRLALAAYNAGENAVTKYQGIPPYQETQNYVRLVIQMRDIYRKEKAGA